MKMNKKKEIQRRYGSNMSDAQYLAVGSALDDLQEYMIDKACKILENITVTYNKRFFGKCEENAFDSDFIKEFRKAMED